MSLVVFKIFEQALCVILVVKSIYVKLRFETLN